MPKAPTTGRPVSPIRPKPASATAPVQKDRLPTLADTEDAEYVRCLWYGHGGTWKTSNMLEVAKRGTTILVKADPGVKGKVLKKLGIPTDRIEVFDDITFEAMEAFYFELKGRLKDGEPIYAMVWDSMTEIQAQFLDQEVAKQYNKATSAGRERRVTDVYVDEHGTVGQQLRMLIRKFSMLPLHWGATALERADQDENTGEIARGPAVYPKVFSDLSGYFDIFIRTYVDELNEADQGFGQTRPIGAHYGKDRFGVLPKRMVAPTFTRVLDYVESNLDPATDPLQAVAKAAVAQRKAAKPGTKLMEEEDA